MGTRREELQLVVSAKDRSKSSLLKVARNIGGIVLAYKALSFGVKVLRESITEATTFSATLLQVKRIAEVTGRSYNDVLEAMKTQTGGLATSLTIATGFLKGLTTTLNVVQINQLTTAIRDASTAMGEDFNVQLPLIIKAIKQLNPAILDNIGVTVRLDRINARIKAGYFGLSKEINETTQQHAIFTEIIRQTSQFQGAENVLLDTSLGLWRRLKVVITEAKKTFGDFLTTGERGENINQFLRRMILIFGSLGPFLDASIDAIFAWGKFFVNAIRLTATALNELGKIIKKVLVEDWDDNVEFFGVRFEFIFLKMAKWVESFKLIANAMAGAFRFDPSGVTQAIADGTAAMKDMDRQLVLLAGKILFAGQSIKSDLTPELNELKRIFSEVSEDMPEQFGEGLLALSRMIEEFDILWKLSFQSMGKTLKKTTDNTKDEAKKAIKEFSAFAKFIIKGTQVVMEVAFDSLRSNLEANLFDTRGVLREIYKGMARDFILFFIDEAIKAVAVIFIPKFVKLVTSIFDTPANDRAAAEEGRRFAGFFIAGATGAFAGANLGAQIVQDAVGGVQPDSQASAGTQIIFNNPITYTGFFRDARRELEDLSRRRPLQLSVRQLGPLQTQSLRFS